MNDFFFILLYFWHLRWNIPSNVSKTQCTSIPECPQGCYAKNAHFFFNQRINFDFDFDFKSFNPSILISNHSILQQTNKFTRQKNYPSDFFYRKIKIPDLFNQIPSLIFWESSKKFLIWKIVLNFLDTGQDFFGSSKKKKKKQISCDKFTWIMCGQ